ncbi:MAG: 3-deoxy-D-manno-octulosonic acid transferase [Deltaproteobacteria bacterium]|jgi:3-deoxy-D-manno-octulosonic-acid transferase|nr:3-deoxy-D-manno-octulosonic acid transferase [Deltaproteobacteria bacterium]MBT6431539.1 3-deoxy-D-manno-octulosonic acid transferase [Deltaproteobacteria bacterium]MBT6492498.1 3-deoxy-D-manno-octulosonic acid transferase [Deltaproteobacteria bacterium]
MRTVRIMLTYLLFPWVSPFLFLHPKLKAGFLERFGLNTMPAPKKGPTLWLHGASAGDVLALVPTAKALRAIYPDASLIVTAMTDSGFAMAKQQAQVFDHIRYIPWDLPGAVRRTLNGLQPDAIILEFAELWPELLHQASKNNVQVVLHNGRFSRERLERYRRMFRLTGNLVEQLTMLLVRDQEEKVRAMVLGALPESIHTTGNTKFDHLKEPPNPVHLTAFRGEINHTGLGPVLVAGSTHDGEEEILLETLSNLRVQYPTLKLIIAPRYIDRSSRLGDLGEKYRFKTSLRTQSPKDWDVLILDTVGELSLAYALGTVVFVGGSINDRGGHNIVEPALCGKPVIFGPYMSNVEDSVKLLLGRGGLQISNPEQLVRVLGDLLGDSEKCKLLGEKAASQARSVQGAAAQNATHISAMLNQRQAPT